MYINPFILLIICLQKGLFFTSVCSYFRPRNFIQILQKHLEKKKYSLGKSGQNLLDEIIVTLTFQNNPSLCVNPIYKLNRYSKMVCGGKDSYTTYIIDRYDIMIYNLYMKRFFCVRFNKIQEQFSWQCYTIFVLLICFETNSCLQ